MTLALPRTLVEFILLGPEDDRRQLQDSPILGDVWLAFAKNPEDRLQLLITPYKETAAAEVATRLANLLEGETGDSGQKSGKGAQRVKTSAPAGAPANVAYLQGIVAARLSFAEVLRFVVPMTYWWNDKKISAAIGNYRSDPKAMKKDLDVLFDAVRRWRNEEDQTSAIQDIDTHVRYIALAGLVLWAHEQKGEGKQQKGQGKQEAAEFKAERLSDDKIRKRIVDLLSDEFDALPPPKEEEEEAEEDEKKKEEQSLVWHVSRNRPAAAALTKSVPAVKADSARSLFTVNCKEIVWAIIDSGIDARHAAFRGNDGKMRVQRSFDFTRIREIVSLDNKSLSTAKNHVATLLNPKDKLQNPPDPDEAVQHLMQLADDARKRRSVNWELVEKLIEIKPDIRPDSNHGTHVAGILAANKNGKEPPADAKQNAAAASRSPPAEAAKKNGVAAASKATATNAKENDTPPSTSASKDVADGMCPDIRLYDFRVLSPTLKETEFAIIAALQYIRYINERNSFMTIHGANLSLSIRHDVRNYACGRTPVCNECERLVNSGVVVVAAAGNRGYQGFETTEGLYEGYAAFSVTDPGNAEGVITVGATHRYWPHTYGVSFFSSRGPTGDGRMKPDLVAPGERIRAPLRDLQWGDLDGTSMAAPHVSGAAAMLMARYSELVGQPRRIKQILCDSATDLGREKTFQGHGMLDVLRAFQSI